MSDESGVAAASSQPCELLGAEPAVRSDPRKKGALAALACLSPAHATTGPSASRARALTVPSARRSSRLRQRTHRRSRAVGHSAWSRPCLDASQVACWMPATAARAAGRRAPGSHDCIYSRRLAGVGCLGRGSSLDPRHLASKSPRVYYQSSTPASARAAAHPITPQPPHDQTTQCGVRAATRIGKTKRPASVAPKAATTA